MARGNRVIYMTVHVLIYACKLQYMHPNQGEEHVDLNTTGHLMLRKPEVRADLRGH